MIKILIRKEIELEKHIGNSIFVGDTKFTPVTSCAPNINISQSMMNIYVDILMTK
jgi:hypothetical protein